eukprot:CAMPEP_0170910450 /NCGR_PEP_ID=MMETSP0735-20130129/3125_2 /TAXON_ID=186038 /ORGANISM="Fragilariopsis kerguelensis, Strain L26-C5" /LENGTH=121 /DNA_ID=CAMNT_0011307201 /DNA_START=736 /DNA_END=1101 /DNA_ORIENTATION=-
MPQALLKETFSQGVLEHLQYVYAIGVDTPHRYGLQVRHEDGVTATPLAQYGRGKPSLVSSVPVVDRLACYYFRIRFGVLAIWSEDILALDKVLEHAQIAILTHGTIDSPLMTVAQLFQEIQ